MHEVFIIEKFLLVLIPGPESEVLGARRDATVAII